MLSRSVLIFLSLVSLAWIGYVGMTLVNSNIEPRPEIVFSSKDDAVIVVHKPSELNYTDSTLQKIRTTPFYVQLLNETERIQHYYFSSNRSLAVLERSKPWTIELIKAYAAKLKLNATISASKKIKLSNGWSGFYHDKFLELNEGNWAPSKHSITDWKFVDRRSSCSIIQQTENGKYRTENRYFISKNQVKYISLVNKKGLTLVNDQELFQEIIPANFTSYEFYEKSYLTEKDLASKELLEWLDNGLVKINYSNSDCVVTDFIPGQDPFAILSLHIQGGYVQGEKKCKLTSNLFPKLITKKGTIYLEVFNNFLFISQSENTINQIIGSYETANTLAQSLTKKDFYFQDAPKKVSYRYLSSSREESISQLSGSIHTVLQDFGKKEKVIDSNEGEIKQLTPLRFNDNLLALVPLQSENQIYGITADNSIYFSNNKQILWTKSFSTPFIGRAYLLPNTKTITFSTNSELHVFTSSGEESQGFPVQLENGISGVYPYVWKGENQFAVVTSKAIKCFNSKGAEVFSCSVNLSGNPKIMIQGIKGDLIAHVVTDKTWSSYNLKRKRLTKSREIGTGTWYFSKVDRNVCILGISNHQFFRITENGTKAMLIGNANEVINRFQSSQTDLFFVRQQSQLFVLNESGSVIGQMNTNINDIADVAIIQLKSGKYIVGIIDAIANNCYIYTLKGAGLNKEEYQGANKIVFHQHADGTVYLTSQSNNYLVRYPINY